MRILHTSDFHIGKKLYSRERTIEQQAFLEELSAVCEQEKIDIVLVAGDLFDTFNPSVASMRLLYDFFCKIAKGGDRIVIAIAGNHDSADRIDMPESFARRNGVFFAGNFDSVQEPMKLNERITIEKTSPGYMQLRFADYDYPFQLILTPFVNEQRLRTCFEQGNEEQLLRDYLQNYWQQTLESNASERGVKVLMTHLFVLENEYDQRREPEDENAINIGGLSAIYSENIPQEVQYTALGHLHRCQRVGKREIWYSGSPLAYSFAEDEQQKYFLIADIEPEKSPMVRKHKIESGLPIKNLVASSVEEALTLLQDNQDYWVQLHLKTPAAISYEQSTMLNEAHTHLVQIIPEIESEDNVSNRTGRIVELQDKPVELFKEYYKCTNNNQEPSQELVDLFKEIINRKNETD